MNKSMESILSFIVIIIMIGLTVLVISAVEYRADLKIAAYAIDKVESYKADIDSTRKAP